MGRRWILCFLLAVSVTTSAKLYVWVNGDGLTHVSDQPPQTEQESQAAPEPATEGETTTAEYSDTAAAYEDIETALRYGDYAKAYALLKPLAEKGIARAQNGLGLLYTQGWGVARSLTSAFEWRSRAAQQGYAPAQYQLGLMYLDGAGTVANAAEGARWIRLAAEQGDKLAQFTLGTLYANGEGVSKNFGRAAEWYRRSAEQGHALAQHNLALLYASGNGVDEDTEESLRWERKAAANGDPFAQYRLGVLHAAGHGVPQDYAAAFAWIQKALSQGYPLHLRIGPGWKLGHHTSLHNAGAIFELIRERDHISDWKELLTIQEFRIQPGGPAPADTLDQLQALRERVCPGATQWNVVARDPKSVLFEWQAASCAGWAEQHEIARIIDGTAKRYRVAYTVKMRQMPAHQRLEWISKLAAAKLDPSQ